MDIEKQTKKVMLTAIQNYSKKYDVHESDVQLMIKSGDDNCTPFYQLLINNKVKKDLTFNEILNVKIDFLGRETIVAPFIGSGLRRLRREHGCKSEELNILIYKKSSDANNPYLYFFKGNEAIKPLGFDFIFGELNK